MKEQEIIIFQSREQLESLIDEKSIILMKINNQKFCATRISGETYLFESKCPHYDHPLREAKMNPMGQVVCPWHSYRFDLNSGIESQQRCRKLRTFRAYETPKGEIAIKTLVNTEPPHH